MDETEKSSMKVGDVREVELPSRGAAGLQLLARCDKDSVVEIKRKEGAPGQKPKDIGGAVPARFEIRALKPGEVLATFYETQPWDKDFKEIVVKRISISVEAAR